MHRILHVVTNTGRGGLETLLMNYYRKIDRSKIQFDFLRHRSDHEAYDDEMIALGGKIYELPRMNPFSPSYLKKLDSFFAAHSEYKIVHVHQDCMSSIILRAAKKYDIPVRIAHSHSSSQDKNIKYPLKLYYRQKIPKYANELFACSKEAGEWMFRGNPFILLNNAIDTQKFRFDPQKRAEVRSKFNIGENTLLLGHIGRYAATKNHTFLIDIFYEVKKLYPDSVLLLIGDGELKPTIENKVANLGISDSVIFAGLRSDVDELVQAIDVFVMPSLYEGLSMAFLEVLSSGVNAVIADHFAKVCDITDTVHRVSLADGAQIWAKRIIELSNTVRTDMSHHIADAGYDITENAKWLCDYYIKKLEENS